MTHQATAKVRSKDELARDLIPLVHEVANQVARRIPAHVQKDDLIGAGMVGLAGALSRFDPDRAETFRGYAEFRIRGAIMDDLRRCDMMSREARTEAKRMEAAAQELTRELGRQPQDDEVADRLGVSLETYRANQLRLSSGKAVPVDTVPLADRRPSHEDSLDDRQLRRVLREALGELPDRPREVLTLYYFHELPMREIAALLDISTSRVCQIRREAVQRLRRRIHSPVRWDRDQKTCRYVGRLRLYSRGQ